mmetsp:Transcript_26071/g.83897  ORF Transcript_26071/g.83897 Transcript_26071/m.83897 type:complete len:243 (-) Transcript_26071:475-1203(-)
MPPPRCGRRACPSGGGLRSAPSSRAWPRWPGSGSRQRCTQAPQAACSTPQRCSLRFPSARRRCTRGRGCCPACLPASPSRRAARRQPTAWRLSALRRARLAIPCSFPPARHPRCSPWRGQTRPPPRPSRAASFASPPHGRRRRRLRTQCHGGGCLRAWRSGRLCHRRRARRRLSRRPWCSRRCQTRRRLSRRPWRVRRCRTSCGRSRRGCRSCRMGQCRSPARCPCSRSSAASRAPALRRRG